MKLSKRTAFIISVCCLSAFLGMITTSGAIAQEYHKEVFLKFPVETTNNMEGGFIIGPSGIGIDNDDNLCVYWQSVLTTYNSQGGIINKLNIYNDKGDPFQGGDFCFDDVGTIYFSKNSSGKLIICKFDEDGTLLGTMKNSYRLIDPNRGGKPWVGSNIAFIPGIGLILFFGYSHIPFNFVDGIVPDSIFHNNIYDSVPIDENRNIYYHPQNRQYTCLTIIPEEGDRVQIEFSNDIHISCRFVMSHDSDYIYTRVFESISPETRIITIQKFSGNDLVFSTENVPPNLMHGNQGKETVVDSKGNIYCYSATYSEIQIILWMLK